MEEQGGSLNDSTQSSFLTRAFTQSLTHIHSHTKSPCQDYALTAHALSQ